MKRFLFNVDLVIANTTLLNNEQLGYFSRILFTCLRYERKTVEDCLNEMNVSEDIKRVILPSLCKVINSHRKEKKEYKESKEFLEFWDKYPRKIERDEASQAYAIKLNCHKDIMIALNNYLDYIKERRTEEKFIPYPTKFIYKYKSWLYTTKEKKESTFKGYTLEQVFDSI